VGVPVEDHRKSPGLSPITGTWFCMALSSKASIASSIAATASWVSVPVASARQHRWSEPIRRPRQLRRGAKSVRDVLEDEARAQGHREHGPESSLGDGKAGHLIGVYRSPRALCTPR